MSSISSQTSGCDAGERRAVRDLATSGHGVVFVMGYVLLVVPPFYKRGKLKIGVWFIDV